MIGFYMRETLVFNELNILSYMIPLRNHSFSTYAEFSKTNISYPPGMNMCVCISEVKK